MALTVRTDEQLERALDALAETEGTSKQEVIRRAVLERYERSGHSSRVDSSAKRMAARWGAKDARLIDGADDIDWAWFKDKAVVGLTSGASSPESLVEKVLEALGARYDLLVREVAHVRETLTFKLPRVLAE